MIRFHPKDGPAEPWMAQHEECTASGYDNVLAIEPEDYRETRSAAYTVEYGIDADRGLCMQITTHNEEQEGGDALVILNVQPHKAVVSGNYGGPELVLDGDMEGAAVRWPDKTETNDRTAALETAVRRALARIKGEWHDPHGDLESDVAGVLRAALGEEE